MRSRPAHPTAATDSGDHRSILKGIGGYDWRMCSRTQWDNFVATVEDAVEDGALRDFISDAAARIDALIDEITASACPAGKAEWVRGRQPRRRPEWIV